MKYIILITLFLFSLNLQAETEDRPVLKYNVVKSNTSLNNNCIIRGKKINKAKLKIYLAPEDNHRTIIQNDDIETIFIKLALCISKPFRTHKNIYLPQLVFQHTNELEVSQKLNLTPFLGAKSHVQFQRTPNNNTYIDKITWSGKKTFGSLDGWSISLYGSSNKKISMPYDLPHTWQNIVFEKNIFLIGLKRIHFQLIH